MAWFKSDDGLHSHPKARRAGLESMGLWVVAGTFSSAYKLEGFVPDYLVKSWGRGATKAAARLVEVGLWERADHPVEGSGYVFHDWEDYNPTADQIERQRELARDRQRRARERKRDAEAKRLRDDDDDPGRDGNGTSRGRHGVTKRNTSRVSHASPTRPDPTRPDPT